jgi:itaconate CoA-transferase
VLQQPELDRSALRRQRRAVAAREALRAIIVEVFASLTAEQVVQRLDEAQIANARSTTCTTCGRIRS